MPASAIAIASRVAGLAAPVAGVTPQIDDEPRLLADLAWSRATASVPSCASTRSRSRRSTPRSPQRAAIDWAERVLRPPKPRHRAPPNSTAE